MRRLEVRGVVEHELVVLDLGAVVHHLEPVDQPVAHLRHARRERKLGVGPVGPRHARPARYDLLAQRVREPLPVHLAPAKGPDVQRRDARHVRRRHRRPAHDGVVAVEVRAEDVAAGRRDVRLDVQVEGGPPLREDVGLAGVAERVRDRVLRVQREVGRHGPVRLHEVDDGLPDLRGHQPDQRALVRGPRLRERALVVVEEHVLGAQRGQVALLHRERAGAAADERDLARQVLRAGGVGLACFGGVRGVEGERHDGPPDDRGREVVGRREVAERRGVGGSAL